LHDKLERYDEAEQAFRKAIEIDHKDAWPWIELGRLLHDKLERYDEAEQAYRKAIEINPKNDWPWIKLGQLLHDKLGRYDEAEQAFLKAIEIDPKDAWPWIELGQLLHDRLERYDEAEQAYRKAIEINPENAWTWAHLGQLLFEKLQRHEEAEFAINKAIEVQPKAAEGWVWLGQFLNNKLNKPDMAKTVFKKAMTYKPLCINAVNCLMDMYLQNNNPSKCIDFYSEYQEEVDKSSAALNTMAWAYFRCGQPEYLGIAEEWANRAVELTPENACIQHTLASIQTAEGKCDDALEHSEQFLQDAEVVRNCLEDATDLMVNLAARGFAEKALEMIIESPSAEILEPLIVGIRLYLGEDVRVATEILEVGKDVAERIREREGLLKDSDKTCR
jgi:tetratricopeptide (TPR) repeat protein